MTQSKVKVKVIISSTGMHVIKKINGELWYSKTISVLAGQIFYIYPHSASRDLPTEGVPPSEVQKTNFASYAESTSSPIQGLFLNLKTGSEKLRVSQVPEGV